MSMGRELEHECTGGTRGALSAVSVAMHASRRAAGPRDANFGWRGGVPGQMGHSIVGRATAQGAAPHESLAEPTRVESRTESSQESNRVESRVEPS